MFDKNIPLPALAAKWDFAQAEPGDSKAFETRAEALKFAQSVRAYGKRVGNNWGTKQAPEKKSWRVWIVVKAQKKPLGNIFREDSILRTADAFEQSTDYHKQWPGNL